MSFPAELEALLEAGRFAVRSLIQFEFGTGTYGVWNGSGDLDYGGVTYHANSLISVDEPDFALGTQAAPLTITLPARSDFGLTPDKLALIENEDYKGRPVTIYDAYFHPDTRILLYVDPLHAGYVDTIDHETDSGEVKLVAHIETTALDNHRDGYRTASDADQQLVSAGDRFFEYASKVKTETFDIEL